MNTDKTTLMSKTPFARAGLLAMAILSVGATPAAEVRPPAVPETVRLVLRPESRLWLEGDSNLHAWSCEANELLPEMTLGRPSADSLPTGVERATMTVSVAGIECGNGKMNDNLRRALKAESHPDIRFEVTGARFVDVGVEGMLGVAAVGNLSVAGATRPLELTVTGTDTGDVALRLQGRTEILMTDFGVEPPTALLGILKTDNEVVIWFDLVMGYVELETRISGD